jgi:phosphoenolpyruvate carboxylase
MGLLFVRGALKPAKAVEHDKQYEVVSTVTIQNNKFLSDLNDVDAGWSSLVARRAHNPKVVGSNPAPATTFLSKN